MKEEYDFSKGIKGKFYVSENDIEIPVYLNHENFEYFRVISESKHISVSELVNQILSKDRELLDTLKQI